MAARRHLTVPLALLCGCAGQSTDHGLRQGWLVDALVDDNAVWLSRDAGPLQTKFERMAQDPYDFMRGSAAVSFRDWSRATPGRSETAFLEAEGSDSVLLAGDPHPENVGTYLPGPGPEPTGRSEPIVLSLELTDFDGAGFGPWTLDVRRATQGLAVLLHGADCDHDCRVPVLERWARAYSDEIARQAEGDGGFAPGRTGTGGGLVDRLVSEAIVEGLAQQRLGEWTRPTADGRRLRIDPVLDEGRGARPLSAEEAAQVDRLLAAYAPEAPAQFRPLDAVRRYGVGVASVPAVRYAILWDGGKATDDDDRILMFREVVDPPAVPGLFEAPQLLWDDNGHRVLDAARTLWSRPDADPYAAAVRDGPMTFKVVTASSFNEALDHEDIADDVRFSPDRAGLLEALAENLARQLASAHGRSLTWEGAPAVEVIDEDLASRQALFVAEVLHTAERDLEQTLLDHRLFTLALSELGPLLGADRLGAR